MEDVIFAGTQKRKPLGYAEVSLVLDNSTHFLPCDYEEVEIYAEDYNERYEDLEGAFGERGEIYSLADMKNYWNNNRYSDPVLEHYSSFDSWWRDTRDNFFAEYYE